jgi:hypothetical protein
MAGSFFFEAQHSKDGSPKTTYIEGLTALREF